MNLRHPSARHVLYFLGGIAILLLILLLHWPVQGEVRFLAVSIVDGSEGESLENNGKRPVGTCFAEYPYCIRVSVVSDEDLCELVSDHRGGMYGVLSSCSYFQFGRRAETIGASLEGRFSYFFFDEACRNGVRTHSNRVDLLFEPQSKIELSQSLLDWSEELAEQGDLCFQLRILPYWGQFGWESNVIKINSPFPDNRD